MTVLERVMGAAIMTIEPMTKTAMVECINHFAFHSLSAFQRMESGGAIPRTHEHEKYR